MVVHQLLSIVIVGARKVLVGIDAVEMQIVALDRADAILHAHDLVEQLTGRRLPQQRRMRLDQLQRSGGRAGTVGETGSRCGSFGARILATFPRIRASADGAMMAIWPRRGSPPWVSTAVLHRPNPVAREMPGFIGFFARRD
jgi:hypothetical protein